MPSLVVLSLLPLFLFSPSSHAVTIRIARPQSSRGGRANVRLHSPHNVDGSNLINKNNERYTANITMSGRVVNVALDTGSTDLWVKPPEGLPTFNNTGLNATLRYGDGTDFVTGDIGVGEFKLGSYTVPLQAFLNVKIAAPAEDADFADGIFGLMGLGFNTPGSSGINDAVQQAFGPTQNWGQSVLQNIFDQTPNGDNFIGIALSRTGDQEETADASLAISEYHSSHTAVAQAPKLPQNPVGSGAWTVTLDGLSINGKKINWPSTMRQAPAGKNIVHLDTGTTNIMMPKQQVTQIYSAIPGAVLSPNSYIPMTKFSTSFDVWVVPCNATPSVVASFGGQDFAIHPLDVSDMEIVTTPDGTTNYTVCVGTFTDVGGIVEGSSDALFGDSFLRNVYSVFDFGTGGGKNETAFVQLLSLTDPAKSPQDLVNVRMQAMKNMPPEIPAIDLVRIFNGTLKPYGGAPSTGRSGSGGGSGGSGGGSGGSGGRSSSGAVILTSSLSLLILSTLPLLAFW
ncbi:Six-hairpin glycosidase [Mycena indigotica]|uniref:Six-hairpin glycosidase n=1 Tax=Mycena indigotica TaxID=2126181 RepID=A0A8H6SD13_9AGAR|nr:Six-hairpin glycosidase [Mycena indigotica]KAF7297291.1 Six-hairpin glycosidase [Mycena indigotica]